MRAWPGKLVKLRYGGLVFQARVERRFLFMRRVTWFVNESRDGERSAWRPVWRMK